MMPYAVRKGKFVTRAVPSVSSGLFVIFLVARPAICGKGRLLGLHRVWRERPRVAGRYAGCYVRTTVSGDSSDHALASDAHLHTCVAGTRGVIILLHSHQDGGANVRATQPSFHSCCRLPPRLEEASWDIPASHRDTAPASIAATADFLSRDRARHPSHACRG